MATLAVAPDEQYHSHGKQQQSDTSGADELLQDTEHKDGQNGEEAEASQGINLASPPHLCSSSFRCSLISLVLLLLYP
jgi:hypothetical protein